MRKFLLPLLAPLLLATAVPAAEPKLSVDAQKVKPYTLARVKAENVEPKAGIVWRVTPKVGVSRATTARDVFEFVAPPGVYTVDILVIRTGADGAILVDEQTLTVEFERCCDKVPPIPDAPKPDPNPPKPAPKADPLKALGRIQFTNAGCTATVIDPRLPDGRWQLLTAAHCVRHVGVGAVGTCQLRDGKQFKVRVVNLEEGTDCAWLVTESADLGDLPFATLAKSNPEPGTKIWHAGYGVDVPGNREDGTVTSSTNGEGQTEFRLNVSSGDSGGGIFRTDTGELVSTVCCTTARGATARVWGASVDAITKRRPKATTTDEAKDWFKPTEIPVRDPEENVKDWFRPVSIPERSVKETAEIIYPLIWK